MNEIKSRLFALRDDGYRTFHSRLIPNVDPAKIIGVRTPDLRTYARELSGTLQAKHFLQDLPHFYYEENNLHALLIEQMECSDDVFTALDVFLPYVDNWATCDILRPKVFPKCRDELLRHISEWLYSAHSYTVRFGIEMLMVHFLDDQFSPAYLDLVAKVQSEEYYVRMMIAWYFATALSKQYNAALSYLQSRQLEPWVHNKTIQKAIESHRVTLEHKAYLRTLRMDGKGRTR